MSCGTPKSLACSLNTALNLALETEGFDPATSSRRRELLRSSPLFRLPLRDVSMKMDGIGPCEQRLVVGCCLWREKRPNPLTPLIRQSLESLMHDERFESLVDHDGMTHGIPCSDPVE